METSGPLKIGLCFVKYRGRPKRSRKKVLLFSMIFVCRRGPVLRPYCAGAQSLMRNHFTKGSRKKVLLLVVRPLRPPPPLIKVKCVLLSNGNKKKSQKKFFFLSGLVFNPPPLLVVGPLTEEFFLRLPWVTMVCRNQMYGLGLTM